MGCDIHVATEQYTTVNGKQAWRNADYFKTDHYSNNMQLVEVYDGRDYDLFAALADVRNRGHITPLDQARGIPADADQKSNEFVGCVGDHSYSHCTLQELYDYRAKYGTTTQSGMLDPESAKALDENGTLPTTWCQWTSIEGYVQRTWTRKESPVDGMIEVLEERFAGWNPTPIEKKQAEHIRIIFSFDS